MLIVVQATVFGNPAKRAACLAGACPFPACTTFPIKTSSTKFGSKLILSKAPFMAMAPNLVAGTVDNDPIKLPIGVLTAETMTTFLLIICCLLLVLQN